MADMMAGEDVRVDIISTTQVVVAYAVKRFDLDYMRPPLDVSNSEGRPGRFINSDAFDKPGYQSRKRGLRGLKVTLEEATFDLAHNLFEAPLNIKQDDYLTVKIYPAGRIAEGRGGDYHLVTFQVTSVKHSGEVGQLQPVTIEGESDGEFLLYGEAK